MHLVSDNFNDLYVEALENLINNPQYICSPRGKNILENIVVTLELIEPRNRIITLESRNANYGFGVGEFLWYFRGNNDLETMQYYNKRMKNFSDDGVSLHSAYGCRFRPYIDIIVKELGKDKDSRRAILNIHSSYDTLRIQNETKDVPCTLNLQFFIRENKLIMHTSMRSCDIIWGLTYDLFSFTLFQEYILNRLNEEYYNGILSLGSYYHTCGSLHIYSDHIQMAKDIIDEYHNSDNYIRDFLLVKNKFNNLNNKELTSLSYDEKELRKKKISQIDESIYASGAKWMAEQLNIHRKKRDKEEMVK